MILLHLSISMRFKRIVRRRARESVMESPTDLADELARVVEVDTAKGTPQK
jgi:hypothetical protein